MVRVRQGRRDLDRCIDPQRRLQAGFDSFQQRGIGTGAMEPAAKAGHTTHRSRAAQTGQFQRTRGRGTLVD